MARLEMLLELVDQLLLDVHDATANLTHGVVMVAGRQLVVSRPVAEVRGVHGT
jgi:hypothetical protein